MDSKPLSPFDLEAYLRLRSTLIDEALQKHFQRYPGESQTLFRALRYGVFPGGKRIRPILMLAAGELCGAETEGLIPFACAVELIHAYAVMHDDLPTLDNGVARPSAHDTFGEGMALLAGDGLLTEAFRLMAETGATRLAAPEVALQVIRELAQAAGVLGLVGGQALDLETDGKDVDLATVDMIHVRKTGALILAAVRIGALLGGASAEDLARLCRYAEYFGLAFQIAEDILATQASLAGENANESSRKGRSRATYPAVVGVGTARQRVAELLQLALQELNPFEMRAEPLAQIARHSIGRAMPSR